MFIGHYAVGFAASRAARGISLGWLFAAVQLPDMVWPLFLLTGLEAVTIDPGDTAVTPLSFDSYPWSHSLLTGALSGVALGVLWAVRHRRVAGGVVLAAAVVSHWVLDWITHRPDLPLAPWSNGRFGLALWNSVPATVAVETAMYGAGLVLYLRATRSRDRVGRWALVSLAGLLAVIYIANVFGPPPPDPRSVALAGLGLWLVPFWAAWADAHRVRVDNP